VEVSKVNSVLRTSLVAIGLVWLLAGQTAGADDLKRYLVAGSRAAGLTACVEPTERMRRYHMDYIQHQRTATVHEGIRTSKYELVGCVGCHISYDSAHIPKPINQSDQFCGACHAYAGVKLNCFDCHAAVPERGHADPAVHAGHRMPDDRDTDQSRRDGGGQ
jgi:hypothetical protein